MGVLHRGPRAVRSRGISFTRGKRLGRLFEHLSLPHERLWVATSRMPFSPATAPGEVSYHSAEDGFLRSRNLVQPARQHVLDAADKGMSAGPGASGCLARAVQGEAELPRGTWSEGQATGPE